MKREDSAFAIETESMHGNCETLSKWNYLIPKRDTSHERLGHTCNFCFCSALPFHQAVVYIDSSGWQKSENETVKTKLIIWIFHMIQSRDQESKRWAVHQQCRTMAVTHLMQWLFVCQTLKCSNLKRLAQNTGSHMYSSSVLHWYDLYWEWWPAFYQKQTVTNLVAFWNHVIIVMYENHLIFSSIFGTDSPCMSRSMCHIYPQ